MQGQLGTANYIVKNIVHYWLYCDFITDHIIDLITKFIDSIRYRRRPKYPVSMNMFKLKCISTGITSSHRFILTSKDNQLYGAGSNINHQLGIKEEINNYYHIEKYYRFSEINYFTKNNIKLKQIATSHTYSTFLTENGEIYVCGFSRNGGLGFGERQSDYDYILISKNDLIKPKIKQISCGQSHTLLLTENGCVWSYGWNSFGQLGNGQSFNDCCYHPKRIQYLINKSIKIQSISTGYSHNILLDVNGQV